MPKLQGGQGRLLEEFLPPHWPELGHTCHLRPGGSAFTLRSRFDQTLGTHSLKGERVIHSAGQLQAETAWQRGLGRKLPARWWLEGQSRQGWGRELPEVLLLGGGETLSTALPAEASAGRCEAPEPLHPQGLRVLTAVTSAKLLPECREFDSRGITQLTQRTALCIS